MAEGPKNPLREKEERRIAAEAAKRKEQREIATLAILQGKANKADEDRRYKASHEKVERDSWRRQAAITKLQLREYRCLNRLTLLAVLFAFISAIGVILSILSNRTQMHIDERAWVGPITPHLITSADGDQIAAVDFKNTGKTFALETSAWIRRTFSLKEIPPTDDRAKGLNPSTLAPEVANSIPDSSEPITPQMAALVKSGQTPYFYGTIWYRDIFSPKVHWTQFCYMLSQDLATFSACPGGVHNKTDDTN